MTGIVMKVEDWLRAQARKAQETSDFDAANNLGLSAKYVEDLRAEAYADAGRLDSMDTEITRLRTELEAVKREAVEMAQQVKEYRDWADNYSGDRLSPEEVYMSAVGSISSLVQAFVEKHGRDGNG